MYAYVCCSVPPEQVPQVMVVLVAPHVIVFVNAGPGWDAEQVSPPKRPEHVKPVCCVPVALHVV